VKYFVCGLLLTASVSWASGGSGMIDRLGQFACLNWLVWIYSDLEVDWTYQRDGGVTIPLHELDKISYRLTMKGIECRVAR
jgi:hypothetical protein